MTVSHDFDVPQNPAAKSVLDAAEQKYGSVPVSYTYMAANPQALEALSEFVAVVMSDGVLSKRHKELAYLKASMAVDCRLCIANHRQSALAAGYTRDHIQALSGDHQASDLFSVEEKAILRYADQFCLEPGPGSAPLLDELAALLSPEQVIELTMVLGIADYFGRFNNALRTHAH